MNYPVTPAIRVLREKKVDFEPRIFEYIEKGGTRHSAILPDRHPPYRVRGPSFQAEACLHRSERRRRAWSRG